MSEQKPREQCGWNRVQEETEAKKVEGSGTQVVGADPSPYTPSPSCHRTVLAHDDQSDHIFNRG